MLVHQLLNTVAPARDGELSGPWLVAALGLLGHRPAAVRQMLRRMLRSGELEVRRRGRTNRFRLGPFSQSPAETARRKLLAHAPPDWDGHWTLALYQFRAAEREVREHVRVVLSLEGFGSLARGVFVHPRDRVKPVTSALAAVGMAERVHLLRATRAAGPDDPQTARRAWDLVALADGYRAFERRFAPLGSATLAPAAAFRATSAVAHAFLEVAFADPELPAELLPPDWPGWQARALVRRLLPPLLAGALVHADTLPA